MNSQKIERYTPLFSEGLSSIQIEKRITQGLTNKKNKSIFQTILFFLFRSLISVENIFLLASSLALFFINVFTQQNIVIPLILFALFLINLFVNIFFAFKQFNNAKSDVINVIRNGKRELINSNSVVLDDVIVLKKSNHIPLDSLIINGTVYVDESDINGNHAIDKKSVGDLLYSNSVIVDGEGFARVEKLTPSIYIKNKIHAGFTRKNANLFYLFVAIFITILLSIELAFGLSTNGIDNQDIYINIINQLVAITPLGCGLLISIYKIFVYQRFKKDEIIINNPYAPKELVISDVFCFDKTGTLTENNFSVHSLISINKPLGLGYDENEINAVLYNLLYATLDENDYLKALQSYLKPATKIEALRLLHSTKENSTIGATFKSGMTYILGDINNLQIENKAEIQSLVEQYENSGFHVLFLGRSNLLISEEDFFNKLQPVAFVIFQEQLKKGTKELIDFLKLENKEIKIISGDSLYCTYEIAKKCEIPFPEKYISLTGLSIEQVKQIAGEYTIFANANSQQKATIIEALKKDNKKIAMIGDGINDECAFDASNISVSFNKKHKADINVMSNDLNAVVKIMKYGKISGKNMDNLINIYLIKTFSFVILSFAFFIVGLAFNWQYLFPLKPDLILLVEIFALLIPSIICLFDKNKTEETNKISVINLIGKSIPIILAGVIPFIMLIFNTNNIIYTGVDNYGLDLYGSSYGTTVMIALCVSFTMIFSFINLNGKTSKMKKVSFFISIINLVLTVFLSYLLKRNIFDIDFDTISISNLIMSLAISLIIGMLALTVELIYLNFKGDNEDAKNK